MRKKVILFALTSLLMSLCIITNAHESVIAHLEAGNSHSDSIYFNSAKFDGDELKTAEDIVRKIPGAEMKNDGSIMINGKSITKILVNGKQYFPEHEYVDLGLSVKWATCNVGAANPEEVGGLFAWGETEPKSDYSYSTYKFSKNGSKGSYTKYSDNDNKTVLDLEDDVAHVKWGGSWRMPTWEEMDELRKECTWTWTELNGIEGFRVTSKKTGYEDRSIFLPANKYSDAAAIAEGMYPAYGAYWSSTLCYLPSGFMSEDRDHAWGYMLCRDYPLGNGGYRNAGESVRPVCPQVDIKHIVDTVYVPDSLLYIEKSVVLPVKQAEQIALLRKLPYLWVSDEGDVYVFGSKISGINFNGIDGIEFVRSPEYSIVYLPFPPIGPLDPNIKAVTVKMDGKGSRPLTPEEMREYGLIGIPIPLPEGETVESYLLKQPGVHKDEEGNIIYPNGRKQTPEDIKQIERFTHISIKDSLLKYQQKYQQQNK